MERTTDPTGRPATDDLRNQDGLPAGALLIGGSWQPAASGAKAEVRSPYDNRVVGTAAEAGADDVAAALSAAERGAAIWRRTPAHERMAILLKAAELADERAGQIAETLSAENGKTITEARGEAARSGEIIRLAAFEGTQLYGETLPLDANKGTGQDKIGFTLRQPAGIVVAISPFNYPALLVLHKLGPALAAGNAVILKPARATPLTALALAGCFVDAGLPEGVLSVLTGSGATLGDPLVTDPRVRKISFTGSTAVGERIAQRAGIKRLSLELGASSPVIVLPDADLDAAAAAVAAGGYVNAGQVCISVQRVVADSAIAADFLDALRPKVEAIRTGNPADPATTMGTLIDPAEAARVSQTITAAAESGAQVITGGDLDGSMITPVIVDQVGADTPLAQQELFGPAVAVTRASGVAEAIQLANSTAYGLASGIFTRDVDTAIRAAREIDSGMVHINWTPLWRADLMPYGGLKASGIGKEGPRAAVAEMTEAKTIVLHGQPW